MVKIMTSRNLQANGWIFTHKWLLDIKQRKPSLQAITPENLRNKEDPKRDIHESTYEGEKDKISWINWECGSHQEGRRGKGKEKGEHIKKKENL